VKNEKQFAVSRTRTRRLPMRRTSRTPPAFGVGMGGTAVRRTNGLSMRTCVSGSPITRAAIASRRPRDPEAQASMRPTSGRRLLRANRRRTASSRMAATAEPHVQACGGAAIGTTERQRAAALEWPIRCRDDRDPAARQGFPAVHRAAVSRDP
jgi:hypothetical protein